MQTHFCTDFPYHLFSHAPGNHGVVTLLNPATRSSIGSITCNGSVRACSFTSDGSKLLCSGNEGLVSVQPLFPPPALHILFEFLNRFFQLHLGCWYQALHGQVCG